MTTFFTILAILLGLNILLLIFSVNGTSTKVKKPLQKISDTAISQLYSEQYSETTYKKAV